jgi:hypothetical protein
MFDLNRDIVTSSGFVLNDGSLRDKVVPGAHIGKGIVGCVLDSWDASDVDVVQFTEKKAIRDGMDTGDPFLGLRRIRYSGTLYAQTRALLYDALADLRAATSPTLAQREEPLDHGFRPLYGSVPTNRIEEYPTGAIELRMLALPRGVSYIDQRDQLGGDEGDALAIPFQGSYVMRDPRIYAELPQDIPFTPTTSVSGTLTNRGTYHSPMNALFVVSSAAGVITIVAGGVTMVLTVPSSSGERILRLKGDDAYVTVEEEDIESLALGYFEIENDGDWPMIAAGDSPYSVTFSGGITLVGAAGDSHLWFWEAYA